METKPLKKILVVDDDKDVLVIARYCLEELPNIELKFLNSGEEAVKEALNFQPDLILLDVMMPKMDGVATLQAMQMLPSVANIPVIFFTAKVQREELKNYFQMGVIDVIVKPFSPLTLASTILTIWNKYQEEKKKDS